MRTLDVLFTPAEFATLLERDLSDTHCVVFDVLRATSTMVTALWNGAAAVAPVAEISEALAIRQRQPHVLLAGEREGLRIGAELAGGKSFDLGNSPREFNALVVRRKTIVMTTTNGTCALRACRNAQATMAASFLNLEATAGAVRKSKASQLLVVCSGTLDEAAYEDVLGAGALCELLWSRFEDGRVADSARVARDLFLRSRGDLAAAVSQSRNARRLLSHPELRDDVAFCLQRDVAPLVARLDKDGLIRRSS